MSRIIRLSLLLRTGYLLAFVVALAAMVAHSASVHAATIVNDTWLDGTDDDPASPVYSENGTDSDIDGNIESVWYQGGDGTLAPVGAGGPLRAQFSSPTGASSATWTTYFTPEASPVTLANAGDQVKVTWVFTPSNVNASNTSQNFRIAVVDSPAASRLAANGSPGNATYSGYGMFMNMGQTLGNSNPFRLMERTNPAASTALLSASGDWAPLANGATSGNTGYVGGTQYTFLMTLTRTSLGELQVDASMAGGSLDNDGTASVSFLDATPNGGSFAFDTFAIRPSGATTTAEVFDTSLFRVEFIPIPEPASAALLGLGAAALALLRRRGR
jgi:hypothetical protein